MQFYAWMEQTLGLPGVSKTTCFGGWYGYTSP